MSMHFLERVADVELGFVRSLLRMGILQGRQ